jgi:predicted membrane protein
MLNAHKIANEYLLLKLSLLLAINYTLFTFLKINHFNQRDLCLITSLTFFIQL